MADFQFINMVELSQELCNQVEENEISIPDLDIIEFCESPDWGNLKLYPAQSLFFKIAYKLWEKYPFTPQEESLIDLEKTEWGIDLALRMHDNRLNYFMFIVGRRGLKSSTISLIMAFEAYRLIYLQNPQKHFNLIQGTDIYITNCAANEDQARSVFNLASEMLRNVPFFQDYMDKRTDNSSEIGLFTPFEVEQNRLIRERNTLVPRGEAYRKERTRSGSIILKSIPTSATGARSRGAVVVIFDEFSHFERPKRRGKGDPRDIIGGNMRTDEAMYRALTPSVSTFGLEYKVFVIGSPADASGKCYSLYNMWKNSPDHYVQQFSTWQVNPTVPRDHPEVVNSEREDPLGWRMEWKGEFVASVNPVIPEATRVALYDTNIQYSQNGKPQYSYIITLDPAKGSDPDSDTYAVAWGHVEKNSDGDVMRYVVDGLKGFTPELTTDPVTQQFISTPLDPELVDAFILQLAISLRRVVGMFYDQYNSNSSIAKFRKVHLPAMETTYTSSYKRDIYTSFQTVASNNRVRVYGTPRDDGEGAWELEQFDSELRAIQRVVSGNSVSFKHPESGPITTDDFPDVVVNLVYQLSRYAELGMEYLHDLAKKSKTPLTLGQGYTPILSSSFRGAAVAQRNRVASRTTRGR